MHGSIPQNNAITICLDTQLLGCHVANQSQDNDQESVWKHDGMNSLQRSLGVETWHLKSKAES